MQHPSVMWLWTIWSLTTRPEPHELDGNLSPWLGTQADRRRTLPRLVQTALGARYARYADDIALSGARHLGKAMPRIEAWVGRIALEEGFALNHRKTRCLTAGRRQSVCSIVVNQRPNVPRREFDRLKAIERQCVIHGPASHKREGRPRWREHLQGRVAWVAQPIPARAQRLNRLIEQIDWNR